MELALLVEGMASLEELMASIKTATPARTAPIGRNWVSPSGLASSPSYTETVARRKRSLSKHKVYARTHESTGRIAWRIE